MLNELTLSENVSCCKLWRRQKQFQTCSIDYCYLILFSSCVWPVFIVITVKGGGFHTLSSFDLCKWELDFFFFNVKANYPLILGEVRVFLQLSNNEDSVNNGLTARQTHVMKVVLTLFAEKTLFSYLLTKDNVNEKDILTFTSCAVTGLSMPDCTDTFERPLIFWQVTSHDCKGITATLKPTIPRRA